MTSKIAYLRYSEIITNQQEEIFRLTNEVDELKGQTIDLRSENSRLRDLEKFCLAQHGDMKKELEVLRESHSRLKRDHSKATKEIRMKEERIEALKSSSNEAIKHYRGS